MSLSAYNTLVQGSETIEDKKLYLRIQLQFRSDIIIEGRRRSNINNIYDFLPARLPETVIECVYGGYTILNTHYTVFVGK